MSRFKSGPLKAIDDFRRAHKPVTVEEIESILWEQYLKGCRGDLGEWPPDPPLQSSNIFDLTTPFTMADAFGAQEQPCKAHSNT